MPETRPPRPAVALAHEPASSCRIADDRTLRVRAVLDEVSGALHAGDIARADRSLLRELERIEPRRGPFSPGCRATTS